MNLNNRQFHSNYRLLVYIILPIIHRTIAIQRERCGINSSYAIHKLFTNFSTPEISYLRKHESLLIHNNKSNERIVFAHFFITCKNVRPHLFSFRLLARPKHVVQRMPTSVCVCVSLLECQKEEDENI